MEKCSFGEILGSNCGPIIPPGKDTFVDEIISLEYCKKDILGHMKQLQLSRSEITTEAEFILCRAVPGETDFKWIEADTNEEDFVPVHKESLIKCEAKGDVETNSYARKAIENSEVKEEQKLLMCPDEGCHCTFQRYGALQNHMLYGRHQKKQEKITLIDRAKKGYARRLEMQYGVVPSKTSACVLLEEENDKVSEKGRALAQQKSKSKFSDQQKAYLTKKFEEGEKSGKKLKADEVAQDIRRVRDEMGRQVFTIKEIFTSKQVASFFSRLAAKQRSVATSDNEAIEAEEVRKEMHGLMIRALDSHPLICEEVVLCEMSREKLHRLKLDKLKAICSHFGIVHAKLRVQNLG